MALKDVLKINRKTFFNPRAWFGYDTVKQQTNLVIDIGKDILIPEKPQREETFEEAMKRFNLTDADVKSISENYLIYSLFFVVLGAVSFAGSFIMLFYYDTFAGWLIGLAATALILVQAFRYHFWHFQIKFRKLGCTFEEWKQGKPFDNQEPKI